MCVCVYALACVWIQLPVKVQIAWYVCLNLLYIILVMCRKLHAYRSLHACLLPPGQIFKVCHLSQRLVARLNQVSIILTHLVMTAKGTLQIFVQSLVTNRQQCVPKLCMWFFVHVFVSA